MENGELFELDTNMKRSALLAVVSLLGDTQCIDELAYLKIL